jgi:hypothetical protein
MILFKIGVEERDLHAPDALVEFYCIEQNTTRIAVLVEVKFFPSCQG